MSLVVGVPKEIKDNENRVVGAARRGRRAGPPRPRGPGAVRRRRRVAVHRRRVRRRRRRPWCRPPTRCSPRADLIVKVKEPIPAEYHRFRPGQQLFTYLHLAADRELTEFLLERRIDSIAYETVQTADRKLPLLTPMSEVAGRMAVQAAAHHLESPAGGAGHPARRRPRHPRGEGHHHRRRRLRHRGGEDRPRDAGHRPGPRHQPGRLAYLSDIFGGRLDLVIPNRARTAAYVAESDVVIGAVLVPGAKAPKLVTREMIASMRPGSVVVDIAIDQGGCFETSRPTTHSDPTYVEEGVVHYCVANIPGAVARTSTLALTSATLPYLLRVAAHGVDRRGRRPTRPWPRA